MGIRERAEALVRGVRERGAVGRGTEGKDSADVEKRVWDIEKAWERLVDRGPGGMGKVYKALAILPENEGRRRPVGFGGDIAQ